MCRIRTIKTKQLKISNWEIEDTRDISSKEIYE